MYSYNYTEEPFKFEKINLKKPHLSILILIYIAAQFMALFSLLAMYGSLISQPISIWSLVGGFLLFGFFQSFALSYLLSLISTFFSHDPALLERIDRELFTFLPEHIVIIKAGLAVLSCFSHKAKFIYDWSRVRSIKFVEGPNSKIIIEVMKFPNQKHRGKQKRRKFTLEQKNLAKNEINIEELFNSIKTFKDNAKTPSLNRYQATL